MTGGISIKTEGGTLPTWAELLIQVYAARKARDLEQRIGVPVHLIARAQIYAPGRIVCGIGDTLYAVHRTGLFPINHLVKQAKRSRL